MGESNQANSDIRSVFGTTLVEIGREYENMVFLDADLHTSTKATMFKKSFADRFYQVGIAEQNLFGIAAGFASEGFIPIPSTFAAFASRRALDQLAISICFPALNVKIPGSYAGVPTSRAGGSHNCIEDISIMRAMPNLRVADPGTGRDLAAVMRSAMEVEGPVYYRIARYDVPELFDENHLFEWGRGEIIREGNDVTLAATGIMIHRCLEAARTLEEEGLSAEVLYMASVKPLDEALLEQSARKTGCMVTAENATVNGGFGAAVTESLAERYPIPIRRIGVRDKFVESGGIEELFTLHEMQPEDIAAAARGVTQVKGGRAWHAAK